MGADGNSSFVSGIVPFITRHKVVILGVVIGLILLAVGNSLKSEAEGNVSAVNRQLTNINNQIAQFDAKKSEVTQTIRHIDHGLNTGRWKADDTIITKWVQPAFAFKSGDEYVDNRDLFISRLGNSNPFVTAFMPSYTPKLQMQVDETAEPDYGQNMSCRMSSLKSYVTKIDEANDIYSYVAIVKCSPSIPYSYDYNGSLTKEGTVVFGQIEDIIVLTYDVAADGAISNFNAFVKA